MTIRLSAISLAGTARTEVAVGTSSEDGHVLHHGGGDAPQRGGGQPVTLGLLRRPGGLRRLGRDHVVGSCGGRRTAWAAPGRVARCPRPPCRRPVPVGTRVGLLAGAVPGPGLRLGGGGRRWRDRRRWGGRRVDRRGGSRRGRSAAGRSRPRHRSACWVPWRRRRNHARSGPRSSGRRGTAGTSPRRTNRWDRTLALLSTRSMSACSEVVGLFKPG